MNNESDLQNGTDIATKNIQGKIDVQYRFEAPATLCNFATAKPVASMPAQSIPTVQLSSDLIGKIPTPNYGYKSPAKKISQALSKRQVTARVIKDCQIDFSELMQAIGNPAAVHQKQKIGAVSAPGQRYSSEL